ncbi:transposase [Streptacidiphilus fuscans]|uniref:Mutator family transposase n=1 Tax=Streptacidiphilus fuscans TaxID=2789292 RepID=A0A931BGE0_9ACTN|nr:transposase [Streptacidiphilus fuscans]MBF9073673.1 transposase [Streptacidiphilus fuscans]
MNHPAASSAMSLPEPCLGPGPAFGHSTGPGDATDLLGSCDAPLRDVTRLILEAALQVELDHHLNGCAEDPDDRTDVNSHNGHRPKTVLTTFGPVEVLMPRDRRGSFSPAILPKYRRDLAGREPLLLSLAARGLPRTDFEARLVQFYGDSPPSAPLSHVADRVASRLHLWQRRRLASRYLVLFADTAVIPGTREVVHLAVAVAADGRRELLSLWAARATSPADIWGPIFGDLRCRGLQHVSIVVGDGTAGLPTAARTSWPHAAVHARSHLLQHAGPSR